MALISNKLARQFASKRFTLFLFVPLLTLLALSTLLSFPLFTTLIRLLLSLLGGNLLACTCLNWHRLSIPVATIHVGILLVLVGGLVGIAGHVATVNIYEGAGSTVAYRWDLQQDTDLGFLLKVADIHQEYYPSAVRIGILKNGKKVKLKQIKIGESFNYAQKKIFVKRLLAKKNLQLIITDGKQSRQYNTADSHKQLADSPISFKLVAFSTPEIKKAWVDLEIYQQGKIVAQGPSAINQPLKWLGLKFYHTQTSHDAAGKQFAGIQIVSDPGIPVVYSGFFAIFMGGILLLIKKMK
jgi:cytochrome c biogenesis protein ResB